MKTFAISMLVASTVAIDAEFIRGLQKGAFTMDETKIYEECPHVELTPSAEQFANMAKPAIMMMQNMAQSQNGGAPMPGMDHLEEFVDEAAFLYSLQTGYEGSQFCKGEILAHEIAGFVMHAGRKEIGKVFPILNPD